MQAIGRAFKKHPIIGNVIIYGSLYTGSEAFQQFMTKKVLIPEGEEPQPLDKGIITRYAIMGTCVFPHTLYHAYKYLDSKFVGPSLPMALRKLAIDALVITPVNLSIFYTGMSALERKEDLLEEWKKKIVPTFLVASVFWVPANLLNFRFLAPQYRVVFVGSCQIIWVSILCWFKRQDYQKKVT
ncbi:UNVERIFIED_CONTAM: hypothetical protein RMT77_008090 [Armadillidium vulgare]